MSSLAPAAHSDPAIPTTLAIQAGIEEAQRLQPISPAKAFWEGYEKALCDLRIGVLHALAAKRLKNSQADSSQITNDAVTVRPTTLEEVLNSASAEIWWAERYLKKSLKEGDGSHIWHHWHGRQCGLYVLLQRYGALPVGPMRRSSEVLHRMLVAARPQLPDGFELLPVNQAHELLAAFGVEATQYEVPYLQRHLTAGLRKQKHVAVPPLGELHKEALAIGANVQNASSPHAVSVGATEAQAVTDAEKIEAASQAITHLLRRLIRDPRIAYYFDPCTESFELLTKAHALLTGQAAADVSAHLSQEMVYAPPTCSACGGAA